MPVPKREIEEIIQLHVREGKQLQEVYVEGTTDKYFYKCFLESHGQGRVSVLDVDTVNIPNAEILRLGLDTGKKGRVITLAALLDGRVQTNEVVCIADADRDLCRKVEYAYSLLLITDFTSIELYILCPDVMRRILSVALRGFPKPYGQVMNELASLLEESFVFRAAADDLNASPAYPRHSSFCRIDAKKQSAAFLINDYINEAMKEHGDRRLVAAIKERMVEIGSKIKQANIRTRIHGHDFVETFAWYVKKHSGYGGINESTFGETMLGFVDPNTLANEPLFRELLRRLRS